MVLSLDGEYVEVLVEMDDGNKVSGSWANGVKYGGKVVPYNESKEWTNVRHRIK